MNDNNTLIPDSDTIRQQVSQRYGAIARERGGVGEAASTGSASSCCGTSSSSSVAEAEVPAAEKASSCCGSSNTATEKAARLGYSAADVAAAPEGADMGLGCGNPIAIASIKPGEVIVDLGSGGGFDCFLAAKAAGETGRAIGVDMTPDMIRASRANARKRGVSNVEFRLGEIESLPVADATADLIISNCVINLSPDKPAVVRESYRVLKDGGRLAISDIVATAPIPPDIQADMAARVGCVAGAAHVDDFRAMLVAAGFRDIRILLKESSREMISRWTPGKPSGDYVVSALIEAVK